MRLMHFYQSFCVMFFLCCCSFAPPPSILIANECKILGNKFCLVLIIINVSKLHLTVCKLYFLNVINELFCQYASLLYTFRNFSERFGILSLSSSFFPRQKFQASIVVVLVRLTTSKSNCRLPSKQG